VSDSKRPIIEGIDWSLLPGQRWVGPEDSVRVALFTKGLEAGVSTSDAYARGPFWLLSDDAHVAVDGDGVVELVVGSSRRVVPPAELERFCREYLAWRETHRT